MKRAYNKLAMVVTLLATVFIAGFANAAPTKEGGVKYFSAAAGRITCYYHASDVCIKNKSNQTIYFAVPAFSESGPLNSGPGFADVWYSEVIPNFQVKMMNSNFNVIFNQVVPNHSALVVGNNSTAGLLTHGKGKLTVTVHQG